MLLAGTVAISSTMAWGAPPEDSAGEGADVQPDPDAGAPAADPVPKPSEAKATAGQDFDAAARAALLVQLVDGQLDPSVDPDALLRFDLQQLSPRAQKLVLARLSSPSEAKPELPGTSDATGDGETGGEDPTADTGTGGTAGTEDPDAQAPSDDPLADALERVFALSPQELTAKLTSQRTEHRAHRTAREQAQVHERQAAQMQTQAQRLAALRAGTLDLDTDPAGLFSVDLGAHEQLSLIGDASADGPAAAKLTSTRAAFAKELERSLTAPPEEREAWIATHDTRKSEATAAREQLKDAEADTQRREAELSAAQDEAAQAAQDREAALRVAAEASDERARATAHLHADMLGVREAQAKFAERSAELASAHSTTHEQSLKLVAPATELVKQIGDVGDRADALFEQIDLALETRHEELAALLKLAPKQRKVPVPKAPPPAKLANESLDALHLELTKRAEELETRYADWHAKAVPQLSADAEMISRARLGLLRRASGELRSELTGFGPKGTKSFERELRHIGLQGRLEAQRLPGWLSSLGTQFRASPVPLIAVTLRILAGLVAFVWWRRKAPELLLSMRKRAAIREGGLSRLSATALWYLERIRAPLEWFALAAFTFSSLQNIEGAPRLDLLWLASFWIAAGLASILYVDALAARQGRAHADQADTSALRIRSLRIVGLTIAVTGLILSATSSLVGHGTIYAWVWRLVWFIAIPVALLLIHWWQPIIFARIGREQEHGPVAQWVLARQSGWVRFVAAAVGGGYLLAGGVRRWALRQADSIEITRRLLAFMFRREVEKQADADAQIELHPLEAAQIEALWVPTPMVTEMWQADIEALASTVRDAKNTLSCVVGERGLGKSTFTKALAEFVDDQPVVFVACPKGNFFELLAELAVALELPRSANRDQIVEKLQSHEQMTIVIDDLHRIVRPALNGLAELDRFSAFVRRSGEKVAWIGCFDAPAWQYVSRARGDRLFFDRVVDLPRWEEEQLDVFLNARTEAAGLKVSFEHLKMPRRFDDGELDEAERNRQAFIRILWDSAQGNPTVALELWTRSLVRDNQGEVRARLPSDARYRELDKAEIGVYFVLRALVQLDIATIPEIGDCTSIRLSEVADAMRFAQSREIVERDGDTYRVALHAYRPLRNLLRRQNLLAV